jgi:hypothetical protein
MCWIFEIEGVNDRLVLGWLFDVSFPEPERFQYYICILGPSSGSLPASDRLILYQPLPRCSRQCFATE